MKAKKKLSLKITFEDRVGFIADISNSIVKLGLNINSMELQKSESESFLFVGLDYNKKIEQSDLIKNISGIDSVLSVKVVPYLPHVERQIRYQIVLDSISDGILSVDKFGNIINLNKMASEILKMEIDSAVGKNINDFNIDFSDINNALNFQKVTYITKIIKSDNGKLQYFSICKPIVNIEGVTIGAVEIMKSVKEINELAKSVKTEIGFTFDEILTKNLRMLEAIEFAKKASAGSLSILLQGESGTGKECFANAIHSFSGRQGKFVPINCAAIPESLMESELFGYEPGAFTGANNNAKKGLIELSNKGTLFLDEISELPLSMQAKLLRVLQEKKFRRIGGNEEIQVDVKFITATNQSLELLVNKKLFREDLFYRLNVVPIHLPPLRQRTEDIPLLFDFFIKELNEKLYFKIKSVENKVYDKLLNHYWKGNVRELKNVVERAFILADSDIINEKHIVFSNNLNNLDNISGDSLKDRVGKYEKQLIINQLNNNQSIRKTARKLGISHVALLNKIKKYNIIIDKS